MLFLINALKQWLNSPKSSDFGELQGFALRINRAAVYSADIIIGRAARKVNARKKTQKKSKEKCKLGVDTAGAVWYIMKADSPPVWWNW